MKIISMCFLSLLIFAASGCRKDKPATEAGRKYPEFTVIQQTEVNALLPDNVVEPKGGHIKTEKADGLSYDDVVEPIGKLVKKELYVENSEPANPGVKMDLIDSGASPQRVIVAGTMAQNVRWKVKGPFMAPKYPASGFVTLVLSENQWEAMEGKEIVIKESKK